MALYSYEMLQHSLLQDDGSFDQCHICTTTPQTPIGANDIWPLRDQFDENLGRVFSAWEVWG